jgi:hypothetical protein
MACSQQLRQNALSARGKEGRPPRERPIDSGRHFSGIREDQMGHSSIQITVDTYGHLIPGGNVNWADGLNRKTSSQQNATPAQLEAEKRDEVRVLQN